ncbi:ATP-binding cassette transporter abc4 [Beauveria bassiana]|uniref:ATP-binding cassette transporter abc4 n=1 Tax=Beauveria bassiana TaxID=176275 RepID=A0A2N6NCJ8_BEABA|nr:ATP-binding cassette transporter abc4 [Beauveria bassiana]
MDDMPKIPWHYDPKLLHRGFSAMRQGRKSTARTIFDLIAPQMPITVILGVIHPLLDLCAPFSLYQLLEYIRNPEAATLQPYVWLVIMFGGRLLESIIYQKFISITRRLSTYCEIMLTGEVFHAALNSRELTGNFLKDAEQKEDEAVETREGTATGMLENLISTDMRSVTYFNIILMAITQMPSSVLAMVGLYNVIGWPMFVGIFIALLSAPMARYISSYTLRFEKKVKAIQDVRVSMLSEYLQSIKVIKYFGWEDSIVDRIKGVRAEEQKQNWYISMCWIVFAQVESWMPIGSILAMFGLYVGVLKLPMTASVAYTTVSLFETVRGDLEFSASVIMEWPIIRVSLRRFDSFYAALDPLDRYPEGPVRIDRATFRRSRTADFRLSDITIHFVEYGLNTITGISGSGKTTLLLALLGETIKEAGSVSRPRDAAFASQTSWLQAQTIRENILFTLEYDEKRYNSVVKACCLDVDIGELPDGDKTQVGANGAALSGGQRSRIALARALYSFAPLLILDDIFSALDTKTTVLLWNRVFCSDLVKGRTVVLVTQLNWVTSEADLSVTLEDGAVKSTHHNIGHVRVPQSLSVAGDEGKDHAAPVTQVEQISDMEEKEATNVIDEEVEQSGVLGGFPAMMTKYWLKIWVDHDDADVSATAAFYLSVFVALSFAENAVSSTCYWIFMRGAWYAARTLHNRTVKALFNVSLSWYTEHPVGRVINRMSGDIGTLDNEIIVTVYLTLHVIILSLMMLSAITLILPIFLGPTVLLATLGISVGVAYNQIVIYLTHLVSASRSPVLSGFSEGLSGMAVIRATSALPSKFSENLAQLLSTSARASMSQIDADQWIKIRINTIAGLINVCAAFLAIRESGRLSAGIVGFCLSQATDISSAILMLVFQVHGMDLEMQTFHRVREYGKLPPEEELLSQTTPVSDSTAEVDEAASPNWPSCGEIEFRNVTVRYDHQGPDILKNINLRFNPGERVAVVGRTGSGKSTILYDGVDITTLSCKKLRQAISMIPQESQLFQGTLVENLDPTGTASEADLQRALDVCQSIVAVRATQPQSATSYQDGEPDTEDSEGLTLKTQVASKGENFSHGQRQILSLCRILARRSKLTLLDEATSSMDSETDTGIQTALRKAVAEDAGHCLVTIAHRLKSIADYDKVVVMGSGEVLEVGTPRELMERKGSYYDLVMHDLDAAVAANSQ